MNGCATGSERARGGVSVLGAQDGRVGHGDRVGVVVDVRENPGLGDGNAECPARVGIEAELAKKLPVGVNSTISLGWFGSGLTASPLVVSRLFLFGEAKARASGPCRFASSSKTTVPGPAEPVRVPARGTAKITLSAVGAMNRTSCQADRTDDEGVGVGPVRVSRGDRRCAGYGHRRPGHREIEARH